MKKCPFCAEEIQDDAVKCKHCGEFLIDAELKGLKKAGSVKWYHTTPMLILAVLVLGPLAIPLVLNNPKYSPTAKIIWTIAIIVITVLACVVLFGAYANFLKQVQQMGL
jgi:uncharacterized membrane protein YvbJ